MSKSPSDGRPLGLLAKDTLPLAKVPCKVAQWHFPLAPGRWRIDPLLHGSADKDNCAAAELNAMYHGQSNTHMATHLRLMPFPMANCTVEVSTASATQSPLANAQHKHAKQNTCSTKLGRRVYQQCQKTKHMTMPMPMPMAMSNGNVFLPSQCLIPNHVPMASSHAAGHAHAQPQTHAAPLNASRPM